MNISNQELKNFILNAGELSDALIEKALRTYRPASNGKKLILPYPPSANVMWRTTKQGHTYLSAEAKAFKEEVKARAIEQKVKRIDGDVILTIEVFRPQRSGDLDNRLKATLDSIKNIAFEDDKKVVEIHAYRYEDKLDPRVEVRVQSAIELADKLF